jgi:hypothetical protein
MSSSSLLRKSHIANGMSVQRRKQPSGGSTSSKKALCTKIKTKADYIMGVKEEMHYTEISPQLFVCLPLHIEIGLVNKVWEELCLWVDQECELLSDEEIEARQMAALANQMYEESMREQERLKGDNAIGLKADKVP